MRARADRHADRADASLSAAMLLLLQSDRARAREQGTLHRDVVLGDEPSRRDGHLAGAPLRRRADRAQGSRGDRIGRIESRALFQSHYCCRHAQSRPSRRSRQARPRSRADFIPGRRCRECRAHRRLSRRHAEEARCRQMGDGAWPAPHRQRADPSPEHSQCRPLYRSCREARRAAARDRARAILRLGLSQPRGSDPHL